MVRLKAALRRLAPAFALAALMLSAGCPGDDITPPRVSIAYPATGDTVLGIVTVRAHATDNVGVVRVDLYVDGVRRSSDSTATADTYRFQWSTAGLYPGTAHALVCRARDAMDNVDSSARVDVTVSTAAGTHHSGTIGADETWTADSNPHILDAPVAVEARLTVEPGVVVLAADGAGIAVGRQGAAVLRAAGTADSGIVFTCRGAPAPGRWSGIEFDAGAIPESSVLGHCTVEYGGPAGLVDCKGGQPQVVSCTLRYGSGPGAAASGAGFGLFQGNVVTGSAGCALSLGPEAAASVGGGNSFAGNGRDMVGVVGGTITRSVQWPDPGVPFAVTGVVTVDDTSDPVLTVAAGCSLRFADSAGLQVGVSRHGALVADGQYGRITFTGLDALTPGAWPGLEFWSGTDQYLTRLNYCVVEYAGAGSASAVTCIGAPVAMTSCRVSGAAAIGISCVNAGFRLFEGDTVTGSGLYPLRIAAPYVTTLGGGNSFRGNGRDTIKVSAGAITASVHQWRAQGVPLAVDGVVSVGSSSQPTLVLSPGLVLAFQAGAGITVGDGAPGTLVAVGVPDSIVLTGSSPVPGAWRGVELRPGSGASCRIDHCRLLYGGGGGLGILMADSCLPAITDNEIGWSSNYCVYLWNTDLSGDSVRAANWLHDWGAGYDDIFEGGRRR